ncbi:MAG TPA: CDP-glucose 4,6-dehydratase [Solirubrobacteraceae bacterium]|nr:CDP-glucose 4,6-dehydratase [Solirubrobacteraceae bacterium]
MTATVDEGFWAGRRVLVTGHTGFKGAWLTLWLESLGAEVSGLADGVRTDPSLHALAGGAPGACVDVRDAAGVRDAVRELRPSVVFHLAAQPLVRRSYGAPAETFAVNVLGTAHVLDAVREAGGADAVVVVTSDKCYEPHDAEFGHRETDPLGGRDPYSASKAAAEVVCAAYRSSYALPLATARAGNVIGGGDWGEDRLLPDVMRAALDGSAVELRSPTAIRPWQHVLNPLAGYLVLAQALAADRSFADAWNFGPPVDDALTVRALVARLAKLWGREIAIAAQRGEHPPESPTLRLDSTRARVRLGWRPLWDLDEGLHAIVEWYRAYERGADLRETTLAQIAAYEAAARREEELP